VFCWLEQWKISVVFLAFVLSEQAWKKKENFFQENLLSLFAN